MAIDTSSLMLALGGLTGSSSYGNNLLSTLGLTGTSSTGSFQNILLSALLKSGLGSMSGSCPCCTALYEDTDEAAAKSGLKTAGSSKATGAQLNSYFEEAEEKYGVSADLLRAIAKVESSYNINAKGESGAQGLMQLMPAMAEQMEIENAYDARENIMGAAKSLARKLEFNGGDTAQAVRSYHAANIASARYNGKDVDMSLNEYVEEVLKYADEDLTAEVASSQSGKTSGTAGSSSTESVFSADDAKYLAEMAKLQMQMQSLSAFNTSLSGSGSSGGLI